MRRVDHHLVDAELVGKGAHLIGASVGVPTTARRRAPSTT